MQRLSMRHVVSAALLAAVVVVAPVVAEDVEKKWRIAATIGTFSPQSDIGSDAANTLTLVDENLVFEALYIDPRNDGAVFGELEMQPSEGFTVSAQYAFSKIFIVEASVGYAKHDIGDVEFQAQFNNDVIPQFEPFKFRVGRISVGEVERIPVQVTAMARFRPRSKFNPYVGVGLGYTFHGFEVSDQFNQLSMILDGSFGGMAVVSDATFGNPVFTIPTNSQLQDLTGAAVTVSDAFEYHAVVGAEYSFKRKWSVLIDVRTSWSPEAVKIRFNDSPSLGVSVPELVDFVDSPAAMASYGGYYIPNADWGSFVPQADAPMGTDCLVSVEFCDFLPLQQDGVADPGIVYIQGGDFDYGGIGVNVGVRYTF